MYRLALLVSAGLAATTYGAGLLELSGDGLAGRGQIVTLQACNDYEVIIGELCFGHSRPVIRYRATNLRFAP